MNSLRGREDVVNTIFQRIVEPAAANPGNPFNTQAPATIIFISGPRGSGKSTIAGLTAKLLVGVGAIKTGKIISIRPVDLRGGEHRSMVELARARSEAARGGALILDDADWLLRPAAYADETPPGIDFGTTMLDVVTKHPRETAIFATVTPQTLGRLREDSDHAVWLGKLSRRDIVLDDLDDETLVWLVEDCLEAVGWTLDEDAKPIARKGLAGLRARKGDGFDNAIASRRVAETLVEIATEEFPAALERRHIDRDVTRYAEDYLE
jgi:hypothetical protein